MAKAGPFEINVWEGGHPIWAEIFIDGQRVGQINSLDLRDLAYAAERARLEAKRVAERMDPQHVDQY